MSMGGGFPGMSMQMPLSSVPNNAPQAGPSQKMGNDGAHYTQQAMNDFSS